MVGAGLAGLAAAARLAKARHRVVVVDSAPAPRGLLARVTLGHGPDGPDGLDGLDGPDWGWDAVPRAVPLPAVLRDLFHSSGRPLERLVDLRLCHPTRRHVFAGGTVVDLPGGSRAAQASAVAAALGGDNAAAWTAFVDGQADVWQLLRATWLDLPLPPASFASRTTRTLDARGRLGGLLAHALPDARLRAMAAYCACGVEAVPAASPACSAVLAYVEQTFGVWQPSGETTAQALTRSLLTRLEERGVDVRLGARIDDLTLAGDESRQPAGRHRLVHDGQTLPADLVVVDLETTEADALLGRTSETRSPRWPRRTAGSGDTPRVRTTHLRVAPSMPDLDALVGASARLRTDPTLTTETVLHPEPGGGDEAPIVIWQPPGEPGADQAWTIEHLAPAWTDAPDVLQVLADRGVDLGAHIRARVDRVRAGRAPWPGLRAFAAAAPPWTSGVFRLDAEPLLGSGVPFVAWAAAHVAEVVGRA